MISAEYFMLGIYIALPLLIAAIITFGLYNVASVNREIKLIIEESAKKQNDKERRRQITRNNTLTRRETNKIKGGNNE